MDNHQKQVIHSTRTLFNEYIYEQSYNYIQYVYNVLLKGERSNERLLLGDDETLRMVV